ncbi:hypothetical protein BO71DRAFT_409408 [Aspergillus ellipticus CBS 707.79]|uniref:Uncharacterized protein n=1 Tax=Aspergillus ellipticus CBS 707.79 TaxID=1448320 RepID=A0A319DA91_9EURO|nr:hypothetical protein BO71DRAFT_409408 [Aspergillus ellipticus CBS 707.79]
MENIKLTFLNTTGTSGLSKSAAKQMRAHITKRNFAKRRRQIADTDVTEPQSEESPTNGPDYLSISRIENGLLVQRNSKPASRAIATDPDPNRDNRALHKLQELSFQQSHLTPASPSEAAWFKIIASEPAVVEASMAVTVRQWSPRGSWQYQADSHSQNAVNLIQQLISSSRVRTDGLLGAVIMMALGAALAHDDVAWNIHIAGVANIIKDWQSSTPYPIPSWFVDFIVEDSINSIFGFPRVYHPDIAQALGNLCDARIAKLADICTSVTNLRKIIQCHHQHPLDSRYAAREIEEPLARLHYETRALRAIDNPSIDAAARAIELTLYLLWPSTSGAHLTLLAAETKDAICRFPITGCYYMNLTSFQLTVGAIAADAGSSTRAWFVDMLLRPVRAMRSQGWDKPLSLVQRRLISNDGLNGRFHALWRELDQKDSNQRSDTHMISLGNSSDLD